MAAIVEAGAYIMGRNMFSPGEGVGPGVSRVVGGTAVPRTGVRAHPLRAGAAAHGSGTTFNFVADGIESALEQARTVAGSANIAIAGGAGTINQYLAAGLLDELRLHVVPFVSGVTNGSRMFDGVGPTPLDIVSVRHTPDVTHLTYRR